jgi:hypothetical protein
MIRSILLAGLLAGAMIAPSNILAGDFDELLRAVERCDSDPEACQERAETRIRADEKAKKAAAQAFEETRIAVASAAGRKIGTIRLGDTHAYVRSQWGDPNDIDRIVSIYGTHEWWWYDNNAVHFADGLVDTIQGGR